MTISTTSSQATFLGNDATTSWSYNFVCDSDDEFQLVYIVSGVQTTLLPSQYTLTRNAVAPGQLHSIGGTVVYPTAGSPIAAGESLTASRILPYTQTTSITNQGNFYPLVVERGLDDLCLLIQQVGARTGQLRGVWTTDTIYNFGDIVQDGANGTNTGDLYTCAISNTSDVWADDLSSGYWSLALDISTISGTVSSVGMTGDNVIYNTAVTGSPITTFGTLVPVLKTQTANTILAGPTTGSAAAPTFRALVTADLAGIGTTGSGSIVLATAPTLTLPNATGLPLATGVTGVLPVANGGTAVSVQPAFYAYRTGTQAIADNTVTKVQFQSELFDTNNNYDSATNYRFTPTVAGYYEFTMQVEFASGAAAGGSLSAIIYKNGAQAAISLQRFVGILSQAVNVTVLLPMNGATDYIEGFVYQTSSAPASINISSAGQSGNYLCGTWVKAL